MGNFSMPSTLSFSVQGIKAGEQECVLVEASGAGVVGTATRTSGKFLGDLVRTLPARDPGSH
jgi:hypothetical protein